MDSQHVLTIAQQAMALLMTICAPLLGVILIVGLVVSVVQAITQIHEATLAFLPKLVAAIVVMVIAGPWMIGSGSDSPRSRPRPSRGDAHRRIVGTLTSPPTTDRGDFVSTTPVRILIAEDQEINAQYLSLLLGRMGLHADIARNGREAVEQVRTNVYAAVLMDLYMPELDGLGATREIRALGAPAGNTPVVLVSAESIEDIEGLTPDLRITTVAAKPLREPDLRAALAACGIQAPGGAMPAPNAPSTATPDAAAVASSSSVPSPAQDWPLVDEQAFRRAVSLMPTELRDQLLVELFDATHGAVNLLRAALLGDGVHPVGLAAHKLKGSAMMLGLKQLQEVCTRIEQQARIQQRPVDEALRAELHRIVQATREALDTLG